MKSLALLWSILAVGCGPVDPVDQAGDDLPRVVPDAEQLVFDAPGTRELRLDNLGPGVLDVSSLKLTERDRSTHGENLFRGTHWFQRAQALPGESLLLSVDYRPTRPGELSGWIELTTNDPRPKAGVLEIPVIARWEGSLPQETADATDATPAPPSAAEPACASAFPVILGPDGEFRGYDMDVAVGASLVLVTDPSRVDGSGTARTAEWHLTRQPGTSTSRLAPVGATTDRSLYLDALGLYEAVLRVEDQRGCSDEATVRIHAVTALGIHVEMTWQPDDPYTDLDLHFLDTRGTWKQVPWDIYWCHPTADWGRAGSHDDPRLEEGEPWIGAEVLSYEQPVEGTYAIGVQLSRTGTIGAVGDVRIYVDGELLMEAARYLPQRGAFWRVANLEWPRRSLTPLNWVTEDPPW